MRLPFSKKVMVHISAVHKIVEHGEFSIQFVSRTGENIIGKRCICTSFHSSGRTLNLKFCDSNEIRKVRRCTITKVNNQEVAL
jgi:hypothetical protein